MAGGHGGWQGCETISVPTFPNVLFAGLVSAVLRGISHGATAWGLDGVLEQLDAKLMVFVTAVPSWGKRGSQQRQQDEKRQNKESKGNVDANVSACLPSSCCPHAPCPGVSLLCCCPRGSYLATAWTPKEGKGTKPDLESRSSGSFSGRPTLHPAVRSCKCSLWASGAARHPGLYLQAPQ